MYSFVGGYVAVKKRTKTRERDMKTTLLEEGPQKTPVIFDFLFPKRKKKP
jgi:hypothetical protein